MAELNDLRAPRRRQTTADIHDAALRLAREVGFDNVTIEQISAEAGVSRRDRGHYEIAGTPRPGLLVIDAVPQSIWQRPPRRGTSKGGPIGVLQTSLNDVN